MISVPYDFGGWATKSGLKCTDGRTIMPDAFKENDGSRVPLVWQHLHDTPDNVLGHAILEHRKDGVYAYCKFNDSPAGKQAKTLVKHGDITTLSIFANGLVEKSKQVMHGVIREVSLVLAGANPGAVIDNLGAIDHGDGVVSELEDEAVIYTGLSIEQKEQTEESLEHAKDSEEKTVGEVFETLSDDQKTAVYALIAELMDAGEEDSAEHSNIDEEGDTGTMKQNVFDAGSGRDAKKVASLTHAQFDTIMATAKKNGSFREAVLSHAGTFGIDNIEYLFPDARTVTPQPDFIKRDTEWVGSVLNGARHLPFSRIKSVQADITGEAARALGYLKGGLKKEEVFALLKRETTPATLYKKQKLDRDDVIDITDMDVVVWLKAEMRLMLDEELARAALISDGRDILSEDKIPETNIRSIWKDADLYAHHVQVAADTTTEDLIDEIVRARKNYKGSGNPTMFVGADILTDMLLLKDTTGRRIYATLAELEAALRVSRIVEVPLMDGATRTVDATVLDLVCIIVNMRDYSFGADRGGNVNFFDDFDIDYNQMKYLIETRCSGALTLPKSALVVEMVDDGPA